MKEKIKVLYAHKGLRLGLYIVGILFILGTVFQLGVLTGYHKASFARDWGDHYGRNFGMERPESFRGMMPGNLPMPHGAFGKVLSVTLPTLVVEDKDGTEKKITISNDTLIKSGPKNASSSVLKLNDIIMVIGDPNTQGQIEAKLIRIMPEDFDPSLPIQNRMGSSTSSMKGMMRR